MPRTLIVVGLLIAAAGALMQMGVPLGRLPGDIVIERGGSKFYFPIVTCVLVSVVLSLVSMLVRR